MERTRPLKRFGQHFLASPAIARRIVDAASLLPSDEVLEIGPGRGVLTDLLAERAGKVVAVELDRRLAAELAFRYHGRENVRIIQADFLDIDPDELGLQGERPAAVVANLPYNAAVPIMEKLLAAKPPFARMVLMVQREMARRMGAGPGNKDYGALSVFIQTRAAVRKLFDVMPGSFVPPPKVVSTVVALAPLPGTPLPTGQEEDFFSFVRACFGFRRKTLKAGLRHGLKPAGRDLSETLAGIDLKRRAESLSIAEFIRLHRAVRQTE